MSHKKFAPLPVPPGALLLCKKICIVLLVAAFGIGLLTLLPRMAQQKTSGWLAALPTAGMTGEQRVLALIRAESIHEAELRPSLIRAGFLSAREIDAFFMTTDDAYSTSSTRKSDSERITEALWTFRSFPRVHAALLSSLHDSSRPAVIRACEFWEKIQYLAYNADVLANHPAKKHLSDSRYRNSNTMRGWLKAYNDPAASMAPVIADSAESDPAEKNTGSVIQPDSTAAAPGPGLRSRLQERDAKRTMAETFMLALNAQMDQHFSRYYTELKKKQAGQAPALRVWRDGVRLESEFEDASAALLALWQARNTPGLVSMGMEYLGGDGGNDGEGSPAQRYARIPLMLQKPGLSHEEYALWARYASDLMSITNCVGSAPHSFAYLIGCCDELGDALRADMKARGAVPLSMDQGPGVIATRVAAPAPLAAAKNERLYMLIDMRQALADMPAYALERAHPVMRHTLLRHLENQPLILPLDPARPGDLALINWYAEKGPQQQRALLFSSTAPLQDIIRHWGSFHLAWWERRSGTDTSPQIAFIHPESGYFMMAVLGTAKGEAAARVMGPVAAFWFALDGIHGPEWYEARPDKDLPRIVAAEKTPVLLYEGQTSEQTSHYYYLRYKFALFHRLLKEYPAENMEKQAVFDFVESACAELRAWNISGSRDQTDATILLWRFRDDPGASATVRGILSVKDSAASQRLKQARKAIDSAQ